MNEIMSGATYFLTPYPKTYVFIRMRVRRRGKTFCFWRTV